MTCDEAEILLHALIDGELDAGHARDVEAHVATCPACAEELKTFRAMRGAIAAANLKEAAPAHLRSRIEAALAVPAARVAAPRRSWLASLRESWKNFFGGFAVGTALSAAVAASLVIAVVRNDQNQQIAGDIVSAHLRSLQAGHLTDVETSDQHTVKPWFNGRLSFSPPTMDLASDGFPLEGGRVDYAGERAIAALVYGRRLHRIDLFVRPAAGEKAPPHYFERNGYNEISWTKDTFLFTAISDLNATELTAFTRLLQDQ